MWVKVDDKFAEHPKVLAAGARLGRFGCGRVLAVWHVAMSWINRNETDGVIPAAVLHHVGRLYDRAPTQVADAMAEPLEDGTGEPRAGLLERLPDGTGYRVHDYHDYQPTRAARAEIRAARAAAGRVGGRRSGQARCEANSQANGKQNASSFASGLLKQTRTPVPDPDPGASQSEAPSTARARSPRLPRWWWNRRRSRSTS